MQAPTNEFCQFCAKAFQEKEIVIVFKRWNMDHEPPMWSHLDCILYASRIEDREHPPK